ncbi:GMC oxidoreductase [Zasmidium cellare ATCC 36951]|uniref:GMC oxidoreductase n=1 Tax=Zasmidium cellare ATCC 36951 TaxID=1080233 RepID=A0A6A6C1Q8_ZASCE|nr:GMC oxidoreductase [Zasmidium cellare ATCC 36951]KAF2160803.1 GMC oxidoreductase [Zasmidium cellare ATCC 36951]
MRSNRPVSLALTILATLDFLAQGALAIDFAFNQQSPNGQPLVSSFFGVPGTNATFDYVIIGGGTGGLAIATRLAQANLSVAVVEAGGFYEQDNSNLSVVPGYATYFTGSDYDNFQPLIDWGISTTVQAAPINRRLHYARGKTLGGSSARNYFLYQRPTIQSLEQWSSLVGDDSWNFANLLPYFKQSVDFTPPNATLYANSSNPQNLSSFTPNGGPVQVSFSRAVDPFGTWARLAFINASMPQIDGLSSGRLLGSAYAGLTIDPNNGQRSSSESSFLQSALNAHKAPIVYKNTLASKILFNGTTATGISAIAAGTFGTPSVNFTLTARKEVILSAGAFQSPQLLMLSGIGNCSYLATFKLPCLANLPGVGQNMWDHPIFGSAHAVNVNTASAGANNATVARQLVQTYLNTGGGPLSIFGPGYYGWEKLPEPYRSGLSNASKKALEAFPPDWPEIEWLPVSAYNGYNLNKQTADPRDGNNYATLNAALVAPLSRGTVKLASASALDLPIIDPAWLTHQADREIAVQSFKRQREIWAILVKLGVAHPEEAFPGPSVQTDEEILTWIGESLTTVYHAAGTAKMGLRNDSLAVVDHDAKVFGIHNLRVVDASAFPILPPGHPQSTVYAFSEKIAQQIIDKK